MKKINENKLAKEIAKFEGKEMELNIAQIKEVMKVTFELLGLYKPSQVMELLERHY